MKKFLKISLYITAILLAGTAIGSSLVIFDFYRQTPSVLGLSTNQMNEASVIYDRTGQHKLYELSGDERRKTVGHDDISGYLRVATIAAEDDSFYSHEGFDPLSILRSLYKNIESNGLVQGGSTITQQLARDMYLTRKKTYLRKIKEIIIAVKLEQAYSKDEILDLYLNEINYGGDIYGVQSASEIYFGKDAKNLTLDEAALLAALPKAPTFYSPYGDNKEALVSRQKSVLQRISQLDLVSGDIVNEALAQDTLAKVLPYRNEIQAPHFVQYAIKKLQQDFGDEYIRTAGLKIYSTLDYEMQRKAEDILRSSKDILKKYQAENAALVVVDPKTGDILAMVGSVDFFSTDIDGQVNVADRLRQPGSSFKPIVYAQAFKEGYQPETLLYDVETNFGPDGSGKDYTPHNYDGGYRGLVSMRDALAGSLNIPAVKTLYLADIGNSIGLAQDMGISSLKSSGNYGLSLVLGGAEVTLTELAGAYSVFANDGVRNEVSPVKEIVDKTGRSLTLKQIRNQRILDSQVARKISSILSDKSARAKTFGAGSSLDIKDRKVAVKTGTTQDYRDAWTVGYNPTVVVGVWAGNNDNHPMKPGSDGSVVAAPIWNSFFSSIISNYPQEDFSDYEKVKSDNFMVTGNLAKETVYFRKGNGKEVSPEQAQKDKSGKIKSKEAPARHSILFYVNKNNPLGESYPDFSDPMLKRWDEAIGAFDPNAAKEAMDKMKNGDQNQ
jgi:1A family penicillin-binding protein